MDVDTECLNLGSGKFCMRGAVNAKLQRSYDAAVGSGSVTELGRGREQIRHAAPDDIFTKVVSDVELLRKAAEVEAARTGLPRRAEGAAHTPIAPRDSAKFVVDRVGAKYQPAVDLNRMAFDAEQLHRFRPTDEAVASRAPCYRTGIT